MKGRNTLHVDQEYRLRWIEWESIVRWGEDTAVRYMGFASVHT
jgi:hypothetical protein